MGMRKLLLMLMAVSMAWGSDSQPIFEFHSNFWVNLHHCLYEKATAKSNEPSDSKEWNAAVEHYRREIVKNDLLTEEMSAINDQLSKLEDALSLKASRLQPELIAVLESAAPVYKTRWWPSHHRANLDWIASATPLIDKYGVVLTKQLAAAYQTEWPTEPIRADVSEYASWAGAYTTTHPTHITMSSTNPTYQGQASLEMLFHEASHAIIGKIEAALAAELKSQNKLFPRRGFWHMVLFYTAGELVRRELDGYVPYAIKNGLYDRGWQGAFPVLEKDWKPYLDGKIDLATSVSRMVTDYGTNPGQ
jgi:hypothetical protein